MRRLLPTLILVILCIGGFWYASSHDFFKEKKDTGTALVQLKKQDVASYTITTDGAETELQQKDGKWTMAKPSPLPLNDYSVNGWIDSFNLVTKDKTVDANAKDLAQFGLDKPAQQFKVTLANGTTHTLSVGDPLAIQGFNYAMFSGSPEVFRISDSQVKSLAMTPVDFMEKSPIKLDYEQVRSLSVDWKGHKWTLTKTDVDKKSYEANWKLGDQVVKGADSSQYLDKLQSLSTEQPTKKASDVKLNAPELRMEVKSVDASGKETTTVYLGKLDGDQVWITQESGEWAYAVPAASVQELSDKDKPQPAAPAAPTDAQQQPQTPGQTPQPQTQSK